MLLVSCEVCDVRLCEMWDVRGVRCDVCFGCVRTKKSFTNFGGLQKLISVFSRKQAHFLDKVENNLPVIS